MGAYYDQIIPLSIAPKRAQLFTIKTSKRKNWYIRILKKEGSGYFQKSLRTTSYELAVSKAEEMYLEMWNSEARGLRFTDRRFLPLFVEFMEQYDFAEKRLIRVRGIFSRYFKPFFKNIRVSRIDGKLFNDYLRWRVNYWQMAEESGILKDEISTGKGIYNIAKVPRESTLKSERQILKQFLFYCAENHYIENIPALRSNFKSIAGLSNDVNYRGERIRSKSLSVSMEKKIERQLRKYSLIDGEKINNRLKRFGRARLYYFIYICRHTLIRPSVEATSLLWSDLTISPSKRHKGLEVAMLHVKNGKGGRPRYCVMPYGQLPLITKWRSLTRELSDERLGNENDFVFPKWNGSKAEATQIGRLLGVKLNDWGLKRDEQGKSISMYSVVRHTGISRRIVRSGWDVGQVATAAGTSIQQISKFYYSEFIEQDPDRWAMTFKNGIPMLTEKKIKKINAEVRKWEDLMLSFEEEDLCKE